MPTDGTVKKLNAEHDCVDNICYLICFLNTSNLIMKYNTILIFFSSFTDIVPCTACIISINILSLLKEIWSFYLRTGKTTYRIANNIGNYYSNCC